MPVGKGASPTRAESTLLREARIETAVEELRSLIAARYPTASFAVFEREDPHGVRLQATVDIDDTDEVMGLVMDALYDIQVERGLPVYVVTEQPLHRVAQQLRERGPRHEPHRTLAAAELVRLLREISRLGRRPRAK
jgi:hypothetical protein